MIPANLFLLGWNDIPPEASPVVSSADHPLLESSSKRKRRSSIVPYLIILNDLVTCIGAGMTVKFFPLFFKNDYGLSPIQLQALYCIYCMAFALFTWLCEKVASRIGRAQSSLIFSLSGVTCLFSLAYLESLPAVVFVFVLRGALQNSIYPIDRSIIMDFVPSDQRGRWNSIESISAMTWSGSAVLGGYLMDSHDYRYTFVITAWIYLVACCMRVPLLWLVPKKEKFVQAKIVTANEEIMKSPIASSPIMFAQ
jgi:MFS family permease